MELEFVILDYREFQVSLIIIFEINACAVDCCYRMDWKKTVGSNVNNSHALFLVISSDEGP